MTMARAHLVDPTITRWYHCVCRCVRGASLLGEGPDDRKQWVEDRLEELAGSFAISIGAFAVMDRQVHVLLRFDPKVAAGWSKEDVVRRWGRLVPPRDKYRQVLQVSDEWVRSKVRDATWVATARQRLQELGWFMKSLKEPISRRANRDDETRGAFFEGRFKSVAILDVESLVASCAFIDLSPVAAGMATSVSTSSYTSIRTRIDSIKAAGRLADLRSAKRRGGAAGNTIARIDASHWLCPIEDRPTQRSTREGVAAGLTLESYLVLLDHSARLLRDQNAPISTDLSSAFARLGIPPETWQDRLLTLSRGRQFGTFLAASRERLRDVAQQIGVQKLANLDGCSVE
jgi:hypothetical protein